MDRRVLGWGALTLGGFALGLLALASPRGESGAEGAAVVLTPSMPGGLLNAILALTALAVVLFLALLVPRGIRRRRKKGDDEFELYHEPPKVSAWAWLILAMLALVPVGMLAAALWLDGSGTLEPSPAPPGHAGSLALAPPSGSPTPMRPAVSLTAFNGAVGGFALLAALASLALMLWIYLGDRLASWWYGPFKAAQATGPLLAVVEASLDDLRWEPDPRRAIVLCYRRFEQVLGGLGVPRAPWDTPTEFMAAVLTRLPIPAAAVRRLTGLFELSRFSDHPVGLPERDAAVDALVEIKGALEPSDAHATTP